MGTIQELLANKRFQLPIKSNALCAGSEHFSNALNDLLADYCNQIESLKVEDDVAGFARDCVDHMRAFCKCVPDVFDKVYRGQPHSAFEAFKEGIAHIDPLLQTSMIRRSSEMDLLYRIRRSEESSLSRGDLFHIPFHNR